MSQSSLESIDGRQRRKGARRTALVMALAIAVAIFTLSFCRWC